MAFYGESFLNALWLLVRQETLPFT